MSWLGSKRGSWGFLQLFCALVLLLLLMPLLRRFPVLSLLIQLLLLNALVVCLSAAEIGLRRRWPFFAAWSVGLVLRIAAQPGGVSPEIARHLAVLAGVVDLGMVAICVAATLLFVVRRADVSAEAIFAAAVAYLLAALAFASLYNIFWHLDPGSYAFPDGLLPAVGQTRATDLLYFSLVTIATLGYGDIVPRSDLARMAASVEAVLGQFYIAVVIAWLVSLHAARRLGRR